MYNCCNDCDKTFISDGQDHQLMLQGDRYTRFYAIFLPQFTYRIAICNISEKLKLELNLKDINGNVIYSSSNFNEWNFKFDSILQGIVEVKSASDGGEGKQVSLYIGFIPILKNNNIGKL